MNNSNKDNISMYSPPQTLLNNCQTQTISISQAQCHLPVSSELSYGSFVTLLTNLYSLWLVEVWTSEWLAIKSGQVWCWCHFHPIGGEDVENGMICLCFLFCRCWMQREEEESGLQECLSHREKVGWCGVWQGRVGRERHSSGRHPEECLEGICETLDC